MTDAKKIQQIERQLAEVEAGSEADVGQRIDLLNNLAWALSDTDMQRAQALSETAYSLAEVVKDDPAACQSGLAYSLRTQGYVNMRLGNHAQGLSQLFQARDIFESLQLDEGLADVLDHIAGIHYQIGNFPEALSYMYQQLEAARRVGDSRLIANAYNNLANIYFETGDYERAVETLRDNLQRAADTDYQRIECLSYLNLAETHLLAGNYEQALENARRGLQVSRAAGFALFEVYGFDLIGKAYLKLGEPSQAIDQLEQALLLSRTMESKVTESLILLNLGQAYLNRQQFEVALDYGRHAITTARAIGANSELFKGHLLLSEVYEERGDFAQALHHFKQYQTFKELVQGEEANQRLKVLQVAHDTETARREAEVQRVHNAELKQEIAEHKRTEAALESSQEQLRTMNDRLEQQVKVRTNELTDTVALLQQEIKERERAQAEIRQMVQMLEQRVAARTEELATFFDLTVLAGRTANLVEVFEQALPRILEVTHSRMICLHLIEADRTALRLVSQQNLSDNALMRLRRVDVPADFLYWLQQPNDPVVTSELSKTTLLPPVFRLPDFQSYLGAQIRIGKRTEGLLSCYRYTDRGYGLDEIALVTALAEQLGMVLESQRLRETARELAVLEERQRLARDLHDSVSQSIYSLTLFARSGREAAEEGDMTQLIPDLIDIEETALQALREMRLLLYELRAPQLEQAGLAQAIDTRLNLVERRSGLQVTYQVELPRPKLPHPLEVELYGLTIEALNNVIKHAAARNVTIALQGANSRIQLTIIDDGCGFEPQRSAGGFGLQGMQERVERLGGSLDIASVPGQGTKISVEVELPDERLT